MPTLIDISHPLEHGQRNFTADPGIRVTRRHTIADAGYNLAELSLSTHHGTHVDAPFHFLDDGRTIDRMALDRFYGPAWLVDLAPQGRSLEPRTALTIGRFRAHEGAFQPGAKVIYRTGWDRRFGAPEFFTDYPSLSVEAARWIAEKRISLLGMDTPTPSREMREVHQILLARGVEIVLVEGLARLDLLPPTFVLIVFPLNIQGGDGSPIRAVAVVD